MRILLPALTLLIAGCAIVQPNQKDVFEQNRRLGRGVNIIGYDPLWSNRDQARFKESYFRNLRQAGFNNVRINLHAFRHMNADLTLRESWWQTLDWAVTNATAAGLMTILDLHEFGTMGNEPEANKEKFLSFWRQLSELYSNAPDSVVFEILNEPSRKLTPELWNKYLAEALTTIRKSNPTRTVIIGPAFWNGIDSLKDLQLPQEDRNLIVTVHYYKPMDFTHQGAPWSEDNKNKFGIAWNGTEAELQRIRDDFGKAAKWAKENNRPVFLGEFGAYDRAPMDSRGRYTDAVARTAEANGWSWAYWQFDSDFILYDIQQEKWVEPILQALVPAK